MLRAIPMLGIARFFLSRCGGSRFTLGRARLTFGLSASVASVFVWQEHALVLGNCVTRKLLKP